jgi:transposase-like protein
MKNDKPYTIRRMPDTQVRCPKCATEAPKEKITIGPRRVLGYECLACGHDWPAPSPAAVQQ